MVLVEKDLTNKNKFLAAVFAAAFFMRGGKAKPMVITVREILFVCSGCGFVKSQACCSQHIQFVGLF